MRTSNEQKVERYIELSRKRLLAYALLDNPKFEMPNHLKKLASILEKVESGELKRVIVTIPPRHGKSHLCSEAFPAWFLGKNPNKQIVIASASQKLADDFGRKVRNRISSDLFQNIFHNCELAKDANAVSKFATTSGGVLNAVGREAQLTGKGAHVLLIDDILKDRQEAESEVVRDSIIDWYSSTAYSRLMPGGAVVVIMARWHPDDLVGWLLKNAKHENWHVFDMPAINEQGQPLWPERYPLETLEKIKLNSEYDWWSLYMQQPQSDTSQPIKPEWIQDGYQIDHNAKTYKIMFVDPAISQEKTSDETCICQITYDYSTGKIQDSFVMHGRWTYQNIKGAIRSAYKQENPHEIYVETVQAQEWLRQELNNEGIPAQPYKPTKGKITKLLTVQEMFQKGQVSINDGMLRQQILNIKTTKHDDVADAFISALVVLKERGLGREVIRTISDTSNASEIKVKELINTLKKTEQNDYFEELFS